VAALRPRRVGLDSVCAEFVDLVEADALQIGKVRFRQSGFSHGVDSGQDDSKRFAFSADL
jgi:hypothetical protein